MSEITKKAAVVALGICTAGLGYGALKSTIAATEHNSSMASYERANDMDNADSQEVQKNFDIGAAAVEAVLALGTFAAASKVVHGHKPRIDDPNMYDSQRSNI